LKNRVPVLISGRVSGSPAAAEPENSLPAAILKMAPKLTGGSMHKQVCSGFYYFYWSFSGTEIGDQGPAPSQPARRLFNPANKAVVV